MLKYLEINNEYILTPSEVGYVVIGLPLARLSVNTLRQFKLEEVHLTDWIKQHVYHTAMKTQQTTKQKRKTQKVVYINKLRKNPKPPTCCRLLKRKTDQSL